MNHGLNKKFMKNVGKIVSEILSLINTIPKRVRAAAWISLAYVLADTLKAAAENIDKLNISEFWAIVTGAALAGMISQVTKAINNYLSKNGTEDRMEQ